MDLAAAIPIERADELDAWLAVHGAVERAVIVAIHNRASGRQTVGLPALQEVALCHGWVDTQTQRIDAARYAVRFVPRRPGSSWGAKNRAMARRLLADGRIRPAGLATLPADL